MTNYEEPFLKSAENLDRVMEEDGFSSLAQSITEGGDPRITAKILSGKLNSIILSDGYTPDEKWYARDLFAKLINYYGYISIRELLRDKNDPEDKKPLSELKSLSELLKELDSLVGLWEVKGKVRNLIDYQRVQKMRREREFSSVRNTLHMAFMGNPGTGKTTVARIVGRVYKELGLLSKGHFMEVSRADLIAGYLGQTALKVQEVIEKAKGGVLFIDEAYSITENESRDDFGRECLTALTKALEDYRDDLVVIVAGYTGPMQHFFESNPGLKSRFNTFIDFPDYNAEELGEILLTICEKNDYVIEGSALTGIQKILKNAVAHKEENFSNGRFVRNMFDDLTMIHAGRVARLKNPTRGDLSTIRSEDIETWMKIRK